jgi:hypothetical protein
MAERELAEALEHQSGLLALAGTADMREVLAGVEHGDPDASLALDVYVHRLRAGIAAMAAALGGLDALVFTGGVGERSAPVRASAAAGLGFLGIEVDPERNAAACGDADIGAEGAAVRTLVVEAREDLEIARQVRAVVSGQVRGDGAPPVGPPGQPARAMHERERGLVPMYTQVFDPVGDSLGLSSIFAALPLLILFVLIGVVRMAAHWAALIGFSVALLVAIVIYDVPLGQALDSGLEGAAFGLFPIMWIVVNAIWIYTMTVESGHFNVLRRSFASISNDQRVQAVIIAFCFGALIEALAGFGTPVAISAVMLLALGLAPIKAASVALVANTAPVAFGAIAIPIITLAGVTELPKDDLGAMVGRQTPLLALIVPLILVGMVDGKRGIRQTWPAAVACGVTFALAQFVCSNYVSVELTDVVASLLSAGAIVALLQVWQPSEPLIGSRAGHGPRSPARRRTTKFEEMVHRRSDATHDTRRDIIEAYAPYGIIIAVLSIAQIGFIKEALAGPTQMFDWPGLDIRNPAGEQISSTTYTSTGSARPAR